MTLHRRSTGIEEEARRLVGQLGGRWYGDGGACRCPAHDDRNPSLSVRAGRRRLLFHCFAGCTASEVLRALAAMGLLDPGGPGGQTAPFVRRADRPTGAAQRIWDEARPVSGTPAETYLARRGLMADPAALRFHERAPIGCGPITGFRPALVAAVRDEAGLTGIQRIMLDGGGGPTPKLALGRLGSGAVRLGGVAPRLGLAEGVETALSAQILFGMPCWAALGAARFGRIALPDEVRELCLFLDHDSGGERAEALARGAFAHLRLRSFRPPRPGDDWNDVLLRRRDGREGREREERRATGAEWPYRLSSGDHR